ncbi:phosphomannomutase [Alishewanella sp. BS5-314]|uniref:phosphomannomutase n=1 Tax=Alishewanella sp. BS5-314 TaxID=2755587 RepID=UPI0021BAD426|nr:phosphomannomutase [Alishewanella sp. BS5-314]MCT8126401.1 phosphomannomutase [Alishewanella sp. BS5-314]
MAVSLQQIISESGIAFGTSGARGLVSQFTPQVCAAFTQSFLQEMQRHYPFSALAIAIDNRPSSLAMAQSCAGMAAAMGLKVKYYGILPTPALALQAMADQVPAIMITGSHIPFDRNGLKFYRPDGEISKADELAISQNTTELLASDIAELSIIASEAAERYLQRYLTICPAQCLSGMHIGVYEHSSAGRDLYHHLLSALGARVTRLERTEHFVPIDTEAVSDADQAKARQWAEQYQLDAIFSTDGDGDRPLIADEKGHWLRGDTVGLLTAKALGIEALSVPVNANSAIDLCGSFSKVLRTRIGSPYVIAGMETLLPDFQRVAGFEANGGFLLASALNINSNPLTALPTRDALLPFIAILLLANKQPISELVAALPQRFTASERVQNFSAENSRTLLAAAAAEPLACLQQLGITDKTVQNVDLTDGVRITLSDTSIIHLRASGNAPELRIYTEAGFALQANELAQNLSTRLRYRSDI